MKIIIDIGHPAHVHYFRNLIKIMKNKGHEFLIFARDRKGIFDLLNAYSLDFVSRGKGFTNLFGKILYIPYADCKIYKASKKFKPDILFSFASPYLAHVSKVLNKSHVVFDDTEHAKFNHAFYKPFSTFIFTPSSFTKNFGSKHIRFNSFMELCYLHPKLFKPNVEIISHCGIKINEKFIVMRFVSWRAAHDIGQNGLSLGMKRKIVIELSKLAKVFISSEEELPEDLKPFQLKIPPDKIHDLLAYATIYIGEGATMASECAMLGTPAIYVNSLNAGTLEEQEKYGLVYNFRNSKGVLEKAIELINYPSLKEEFQKKKRKMLSDKIDVTAFMVWFIENYPESKTVMKKNPDYQYSFV